MVCGNWDNAPKQYFPARNELTYNEHVILRGTGIVVPAAFRKRITSEIADEGHQRIVKIEERLVQSKEEAS